MKWAHAALMVFFLAPAAHAETSAAGQTCYGGVAAEGAMPALEAPPALKVERVIDGATFEASGKTIRIWGIDAPDEGEPEFETSRLFLEGILNDPYAPLSCDEMYLDEARQGIMMCYSDALDLGALMVGTGHAKDFREASGGFYKKEEESARQSLRGIWKKPLQ